MKQKLALCCALIHRPSVLFLDEPTTGVDALSRKEFWEMLQGLKKQGITILVSTPYMDEAGLCDKVLLLQKGNILSINTPVGITKDFRKPLFAMKGANMLSLLNDIKKTEWVSDAYPFGYYHHAVLKAGSDDQALKEFLLIRHPQLEMKRITANIEDCFIDLMKAT